MEHAYYLSANFDREWSTPDVFGSYDSNLLPSNLFGRDIIWALLLSTSPTMRWKFGEWRVKSGRIREMNWMRSEKSIGVDEEGWVRAEDFEERYDRYRKVKEWMSKGGTERNWPFSGPMVDEGGKDYEGSLRVLLVLASFIQVLITLGSS